MATLSERFWVKVDRRGPDECWPWLAGRDRHGYYGRFGIGGKMRPAQAVAWELWHGRPLPPETPFGCHTCDVRYPAGSTVYRVCCNPTHVEPGTHATNQAHMAGAGRSARGERHGRVKLTERLVRSIRERSARGETGCSIAVDVLISKQQVSKIINGKRWNHVQ